MFLIKNTGYITETIDEKLRADSKICPIKCYYLIIYDYYWLLPDPENYLTITIFLVSTKSFALKR
jgi:hypothetical protein